MYQNRKKEDQDERFPVEHYNLRFEPIIQENKLFIKAYDDKTNVFKYEGCMDVSPCLNLNFFCKSLEERNLKIEEINEDELIIGLDMIKIKFTSVEKEEKNEFYERLRKLEERQQSYDEKIEKQSKKIEELEKAMEELKEGFDESLKSEINKKLNTTNSRLEENNGTLAEHEIELKKLNVQKLEMDQFIVEKQLLIKSIEFQKMELEKKFKKEEEELTKINKEVIRLSFEINTRANEIESIFSYLKSEKNKISEQNIVIEKINEEIIKMNTFPWGFSHLNEPIKSSKWSTELKSKQISINGNIAQLKNQANFFIPIGYFEFCLLNASFSNAIKNKQSWAIRINKMTDVIRLGICLKGKMLKYNFNFQNINWEETGHGFYMIGSYGICYSHSEKDFNCVEKSFEFGTGDAIDIEYDPIECKLRFSKNKVEYVEMPIISPPENDAYHPCVALRFENESVELIPWS